MAYLCGPNSRAAKPDVNCLVVIYEVLEQSPRHVVYCIYGMVIIVFVIHARAQNQCVKAGYMRVSIVR